MTMTENELKDGRVVGIAGPVIDVEFPRNALPELNTALEFEISVDGEPTQVLADLLTIREVFGQVGFGTGGWDSDFPNSMLEILRVNTLEGGADNSP